MDNKTKKEDDLCQCETLQIVKEDHIRCRTCGKDRWKLIKEGKEPAADNSCPLCEGTGKKWDWKVADWSDEPCPLCKKMKLSFTKFQGKCRYHEKNIRCYCTHIDNESKVCRKKDCPKYEEVIKDGTKTEDA